MVGDDSAKIKFTIYGKVDADYTGFLLFFRQDCGQDFLKGSSSFQSSLLSLFLALEDGRVTWDILDRGNYYTPSFVYRRDDGSQSNVAIQFR